MIGRADMSDINRKQSSEQLKKSKEHTLSLLERGKLRVSGVNDVTSFDSEGTVLDTVLGIMSVDGSGLKLDLMDTESGTVEINGRIDSIAYSDRDSGERRGLFKRLMGC